MKKRWRFVLILLASVALLLLVLSVAVQVMLAPPRLTRLVNKYANQFPAVQIYVEEANIKALRYFPNVSVVLKNGFVAEKSEERLDTILSFYQARALIQPAALLKRHISIPRLFLENAKVHIYTDPQGNSNLDLFSSDEDTLDFPYRFSLGRFTIRDTLLFTYDNRENSLYYHTGIEDLSVRLFRRQPDIPQRHRDSGILYTGFYTGARTFTNTLVTGKDTLFNNIPFHLRGRIAIDNVFDRFYFSDCQGLIGEAPYLLNGFLGLHQDSLELRGTLDIDTVSFTGFVRAYPDPLVPIENVPVTHIPITVQCAIDGAYYYHTGKWPSYRLAVSTGKGPLALPEENIAFTSFQTAITATYNPANKDYGTVLLHKLHVKNQALEVQAQGSLASYTDDPFLQLTATGQVHAEEWAECFKDMPEHQAEGTVSLSIQTEGKWRHFNVDGIHNIFLSSHIETPALKIHIPDKQWFWESDSTSLHLNIHPDVFLADTTGRYPLAGSLTAKRVHVAAGDTIRLDMEDAHAQLTFESADSLTKTPELYAHIDAGSAKGTIGMHQIVAQALNVSTNIRQTPSRRSGTRTRRDTTTRRSSSASSERRAFARTLHEFSHADLQWDFGFDRETRQLLRQWQANGRLKTNDLSWNAPGFPLSAQMHSVDLELNDNTLNIHHAAVKAGQSDVTLKGRLDGIRRALVGRARLGLDIHIQGDTLEGNELIEAFRSTEIRSEKEEAATEDPLLIVPGNVSLRVLLEVSNAYYRHLHLKDVSGSLLAINRRLHIRDLQGQSDIGNFRLDAVYATPAKDSLMAGIDLEMEDVLLEEVTQLLPSMDTLFPMMQSFRGLVDLQLAATTNLDTTMHLVLPSLQGACRIKGHGLVLLDGETFSEISSKLFFKKKALNLIDSIQVEAVVSDSRVDVFPFIMQMDRYRAAIAGSHHIDKTFHYHISLLKSPLPFRLGIDVQGTPEKYKIVPGRSLFTNEKLPAFSFRIDTIRINLRESIKRYFDDM